MTENSILFDFISGTSTIIFFSISFLLVLYIQKKKQNEFHQIQEQNEVLFQNQLLETRVQVQEESMKIISRELHDSAAQNLIALQIQLSALKTKIPALTTTPLFNDIEEQVEQVKQELRNISHALHNEQIKKYGLFEMMRKELTLLQQSKPINITFNIVDSLLRMPDMTEILIFRIFQEGIHNAIKHADASNIMVDFSCNAENCVLEIMDNGKGFDLEKVNKEGGIGMNNMKVRAAIIKSELLISSQTNQGCHIKLTIPKTMYHGA